MKATPILLAIMIAACGPSGRDNNGDDDGVDANGGDGQVVDPNAIITGRVYAPNQGPGQAAPGQEIPIAGALVYVSDVKPEPIPDHVYCEECVPTPNGGTLTGADGSFTLSVAPGNYWLMIQKGQYRIEQQIGLSQGSIALPPAQTTLPSQWKPEAGLFMPRIAMAQGTNDNIEDILGKLGVGTMSGNGFGSPQGENGPEIDILTYSGTTAGSVTYLLQNVAEMRKYHIIFFPCATSMSSLDALLQDQNILKNVRQYVKEGGKLYVTDWSGELADRAFPQQVQLGDDGADSEGTYDPAALTGTLTLVGDANGSLYESPDGKAIDQDLNTWLGLQSGPHADGAVGMYNPNMFEIPDTWNWIKKVNPVMVGIDDMGTPDTADDMPKYDMPKVWVTGSDPGNPLAQQKPMAVTYQPTGCGKVLFTTFQTANSEHVGLFEKERVLLFLIMEIQACTTDPIL